MCCSFRLVEDSTSIVDLSHLYSYNSCYYCKGYQLSFNRHAKKTSRFEIPLDLEFTTPEEQTENTNKGLHIQLEQALV